MTGITDAELDGYTQTLSLSSSSGLRFFDNGQVERLVAALRSATAERDALAEIIETNQETATMKLALDNTAAELERERTKNREARAALSTQEESKAPEDDPAYSTYVAAKMNGELDDVAASQEAPKA